VESKLTALGSEATLAEATGAVSRDAFHRIVLEHQRRIHRVLLALLHDSDAADSLTQECFLRAFERRAGFRGEANIGTWLVRIAINLARDHTRSRRVAFWRHLLRNDGSHNATMPDPGPSPDRALMARERLHAVQTTVDRLSHRQRACFLLRFVEAMTLEEIAQAMDLKVGTVKAHLARAVGTVRRAVVEWEGSWEDI